MEIIFIALLKFINRRRVIYLKWFQKGIIIKIRITYCDIIIRRNLTCFYKCILFSLFYHKIAILFLILKLINESIILKLIN